MVSETVGLENSSDFAYIPDTVDRIVLQSALNILSEEEREIVLLYAVSGMKHREIASNLRILLSTGISKYGKVLKKLRLHLKKQGVDLAYK